MIPAFIYFANNNIVFFILKLVDPVTFQLLSQLKTIFTGLLFRLFLQRRLSAIQYTALITLACGTATAQIPSDDSNHESALGGLLLSVVSAFPFPLPSAVAVRNAPPLPTSQPAG